jgi:hypothetical protein
MQTASPFPPPRSMCATVASRLREAFLKFLIVDRLLDHIERSAHPSGIEGETKEVASATQDPIGCNDSTNTKSPRASRHWRITGFFNGGS